jgi:hypothetical protein
MTRISILFAALAGLLFALSPLESDCVLFDGTVNVCDGSAQALGFLDPGRKPVGFYLAVEGVEQFSVSVNGVLVKAVEPGETRRTIIRSIDLSDFAGLLQPGANRLAVEERSLTPKTPRHESSDEDEPGPRTLRLRAWTSDRAWYVSSFHAHTTYSDGALSMHDLLAAAAGDGGRAYAVTDHSTMAHLSDTAFHDVGNLRVIRGTEWTTDSGHACLLGLQGDSIVAYRSVWQLIDDATHRGAMVQVNHPTDLTMEWLHVPVLDPGLDWIEVFNSLSYFPPGRGLDSDAQAVAWWQELLSNGVTIAGIGCSDYHGTYPGEAPLKSCSFVYAPSNHPDTILKCAKLGTVMVFDTPDDSKIWLYADTNNNGAWDLVMGEHCRIPSGTRTIRFRLEVEDADWTDEVYVYDKSGEYFSEILWTGGDFDHEWSRSFSSADRDFYRVELCAEFGADYEGVTNPVYVNHPDYELGPTELLTSALSWPDTLYVGVEDTLRLILRNTSGYSPYRYAIMAALDTTLFELTSWQTQGPGIGQLSLRSAAGHQILEWRGGYQWQNRLSPGTNFTYWIAVRPKAVGQQPLLFRSWADDRIFLTDKDPATGFLGPESEYWLRKLIPVDELTGQAELPGLPGRTELRVPGVCFGRMVVDLGITRSDPARGLSVFDSNGRLLERVAVSRLPAGDHRFALSPAAAGIYFLSLSTAGGAATQRTTLIH